MNKLTLAIETDFIKNTNIDDIKKFLELEAKKFKLMHDAGILVTIYTNASGFLWELMVVDSGTTIADSDYSGDCEYSGTFTTYNTALEACINIVESVTPFQVHIKQKENNSIFNYQQLISDKRDEYKQRK